MVAFMNYYNLSKPMEKSDSPYVENIAKMVSQNNNFRTTVWTGCHSQMTLMCIPGCDEIGLEVHPHSDQIIRIEQGRACVKMGECKERLHFCQKLCVGEVVFIPAGIWHNIINMEDAPLKLSVIYAPPNHPRGTIHRTKADAEKEEY